MPTLQLNRPRPHPALIILPPALGVFMVTLDTTAANVALNQIHTQFNADLAAQQWIVDGYQIVYASLLLSAGALGDRIGNRTAFLAGMTLFLLASILCALAPSPITLILARLGQGVGAALLVPASLSVVRHGFHEERARATAVSLWAATGSTALVAGPLLGGYLVQHFTWRSIFWLNVPVGLISILLSLKSLAKSSPSATAKLPLNLRAQSFGILALAAAAFILIEGPHAGWTSPTVLTAALIAAPALTLFLLTEFRHKNPIVPRHLWSRPEFVTVISVGFITNYTYYGLIFLLSLFFTQSRGLPPAEVGIAFLPMTLSVMFANLLSGKITAARGPRPALLLGQSLFITAVLALPFLAASPYALAADMLLLGVGGGLIIPAITAATLESVPKQAAGIAAAILQTSRQIGGVFGVALFGAALAFGGGGNFSFPFYTVAGSGGMAAVVGFLLALRFVPRRGSPKGDR